MPAVANLEEVRALLERGAHFFVGHSGGKDSQAMFAALRDFVPADRLHVVHADLGAVEWDGVKDHIRENIDGRELLLAQAIFADGTPKDFFGLVRQRRAKLDRDGKTEAPAWPDKKNRFCTSDLKTGPIWKTIRAAGDLPLVVNCCGIRAEESPDRRKRIETRGTLTANAKNTNSKREAFDWWPIAHWTTEEVFAEIAAAGEKPHPAYARNDRLSCVFCIFGNRRDLAHGLERRPELAQALVELEVEVRSTMFNGESLAERLGGLVPVPEASAA